MACLSSGETVSLDEWSVFRKCEFVLFPCQYCRSRSVFDTQLGSKATSSRILKNLWRTTRMGTGRGHVSSPRLGETAGEWLLGPLLRLLSSQSVRAHIDDHRYIGRPFD